jgi:hypothetical protein
VGRGEDGGMAALDCRRGARAWNGAFHRVFIEFERGEPEDGGGGHGGSLNGAFHSWRARWRRRARRRRRRGCRGRAPLRDGGARAEPWCLWTPSISTYRVVEIRSAAMIQRRRDHSFEDKAIQMLIYRKIYHVCTALYIYIY